VTDISRFEEEVRDFLSDNLTPELQRAGRMGAGIYADQPVALEWHQILNKKGWAVPSWPVEYGGTGWTLEQHAIFQRELVLSYAPVVSPNATRMVGPVIIAFGTDDQKAHYLPRIRTGEDWWAQGYSEPGAGSDLAALQCKAVRNGDHYVVNGSKIWTTHAQWSNKIFCLLRTDNSGKPQQGISFVLSDLNIPGITVQPLISISGDHEFNQVFFEDARLPVSGLLGEENDGWTVAKYLLQHERGGQYATRLQTQLERIKEICRSAPNGYAEPLIEDASFSRHLAQLEIELDTLAAFERRLFDAVKGGEPIGSMSSALKVRGTEMRQAVSELIVQMVGFYGAPYQPEARIPQANVEPIGSDEAAIAMPRYLNDRAASIYAGSNEVQRNIMSKAVLGL